MALSRNDIKNKLMDIMKVMKGDDFDTSKIGEDAVLTDDLGLNSVGVLYIVIAIEELFGIEFESVGFSDFKTLGDVMDYIEEKTRA